MIKYNLHDSLIESVNYDFQNKILDITIDLCNWLQDNYIESEPENIIIHMIFSDVINFDTKFLNFNFNSNEIFDVIEINDNMTITLSQQLLKSALRTFYARQSQTLEQIFMI